MISTTTRLVRTGLVLAIAAMGLAGRADQASGQYRLDPYKPDSGQYEAFTYPIIPNNLGLPGAAREAAEYNAAAGGFSRFNTFERYLIDNDLDSSSSTRRRPTGPGVPYYDSFGRSDSARSRTYAPTRDADQKIAEYEDNRLQLEARRQNLYKKAQFEKDPVKRAAILREYRELTRPIDPRTQASSASVDGVTPRAPARMAPATPRRSASENLAAEALAAPSTDAGRTRTPTTSPRRGRPEDFLPESRPLLPSEMIEREGRLQRRPRTVPGRPPASDAPAPLPSPVPSPDSTAAPR